MIGKIVWVALQDPCNSGDERPVTGIDFGDAPWTEIVPMPGTFGEVGDTVEVTVRIIPENEEEREAT